MACSASRLIDATFPCKLSGLVSVGAVAVRFARAEAAADVSASRPAGWTRSEPSLLFLGAARAVGWAGSGCGALGRGVDAADLRRRLRVALRVPRAAPAADVSAP